jgi:hypothetical protein
MDTIVEPNWDSLGDKELVAIIRSRTGEEVVAGRMAHANLVAKAQKAFRHGAHETKPAAGAEATTDARDTAPKSGDHGGPVAAADARRTPGELAESASGNPLNQAQPERRAMGQPEPAPAPAASRAAPAKPSGDLAAAPAAPAPHRAPPKPSASRKR